MSQAVCEDIIRQVLPPAMPAKKPVRRGKKAA
jgi:hypothetical protein